MILTIMSPARRATASGDTAGRFGERGKYLSESGLNFEGFYSKCDAALEFRFSMVFFESRCQVFEIMP